MTLHHDGTLIYFTLPLPLFLKPTNSPSPCESPHVEVSTLPTGEGNVSRTVSENFSNIVCLPHTHRFARPIRLSNEDSGQDQDPSNETIVGVDGT